MYKDTLATLQRKFGRAHAVSAGNLDKLSTFPTLEMRNSENFVSFNCAISGPVAVFKSVSFKDDLNKLRPFNKALKNFPPNLKEAWSMVSVSYNWQRSTLLDFNYGLEEKT